MVSEADHVWITLLSQRLEFCEWLAQWRQANAMRIGARGANDAPEDPATALAFHRAGALGEAAGMLYCTRIANMAVPWNLYDLARPDLAGFIDIKANMRSDDVADLIVQRDKNPALAYVLARVAWSPKIALIGWCWGYEALARDVEGRLIYLRNPSGRPACFVPPHAPCMKPMAALAIELLKRRAEIANAIAKHRQDCAQPTAGQRPV